MLTPLVTALSSLIVFALLIVSASAAATAENQKNLQVLTEMTTVLKNLDLVSFVKR